jgi:hypothetical protein
MDYDILKRLFDQLVREADHRGIVGERADDAAEVRGHNGEYGVLYIEEGADGFRLLWMPNANLADVAAAQNTPLDLSELSYGEIVASILGPEKPAMRVRRSSKNWKYDELVALLGEPDENIGALEHVGEMDIGFANPREVHEYQADYRWGCGCQATGSDDGLTWFPCSEHTHLVNR